MHPAFQNVLHDKQRKYYANAMHGSMDMNDMLDKNRTNRDVRNCIANVLQSDYSRKIGTGTECHRLDAAAAAAITGRLRNASQHCDNSDVSQDSDDEEIDLTSNGIDFSNNNNSKTNSAKNARKSEKSAIY